MSNQVRPVPLTASVLRHCPTCGAPIGAVAPVICHACGAEHWRNPKPCAGGVVVRDGTVLLVRRAIDPWRGAWDIPGGFCDADEHPEETVVREVKEEVGLTVTIGGLLGIWLDAYGSGAGPGPPDVTMNCYYLATVADDANPVVDPREASDARWFAADDLPENLAFPDHARQVLGAWRATVASEGDASDARGGVV